MWKLGKPVGKGGPWADADVKAGIASDPYLIGFYDQRSLELSHQSVENITFTVEVDPTGDDDWVQYEQFVVKQGEKFKHQFPKSFLARWIRIVADKNCQATAWFTYN